MTQVACNCGAMVTGRRTGVCPRCLRSHHIPTARSPEPPGDLQVTSQLGFRLKRTGERVRALIFGPGVPACAVYVVMDNRKSIGRWMTWQAFRSLYEEVGP